MTPTRKAKGAAARATTKPAVVKRGAKRESTIPESGTTETQRASRRPAQAVREAPRTRSTTARHKAAAPAALLDSDGAHAQSPAQGSQPADEAAPPSSIVSATPVPPTPAIELGETPKTPPPAITMDAPMASGASDDPPGVAPSVADDAVVEPRVVQVEAAPVDAAEVDALAQSLGDVVVRHTDAWVHYLVVRRELGLAGVQALVRRAREVDAAGGMTVVDGERKRTLGGIFFALAREQLGPLKWRTLRKTVRQTAQKAPTAPVPKPARPEPEVLVRRRGVW